jgi:hypothetical protein
VANRTAYVRAGLVLGALVLGPPAPGWTVEANGPYGVYPDCIAPAVPLEVHSWWHEAGEEVPRHLHHAACLPAARTADCSDPANPVITRPVTFNSRITAYNNRDPINIIRWSWQSSVHEVLDVGWQCTPGSGQTMGTHRSEECQWYGDMTLDPSLGNGGLDELRLTPNISENDLGKRQFATLNYQICTGTGSNHYRSTPSPIGRGWYEGFDYSNVRVNYMDFFRGTGETIPTVSGVVPLRIDHEKGSGTTRSQLWQDMNHHLFPTLFLNPPPIGVPHSSGGVLLYDHAGLFDGVYQWDTTGLPDGIHSLYFQTYSSAASGTSAGALKVFFRVANGNPPGSTPPPPEPDPAELTPPARPSIVDVRTLEP